MTFTKLSNLDKSRSIHLAGVAGSAMNGLALMLRQWGFKVRIEKRVTDRAVAEQLAKETGIKLTENDILMTVGAAGAINVALKTILDPGDEVIVFLP